MKKVLALSLAAVLLFSLSFADVVAPAAPLTMNFQEAYKLGLKNSMDVKIADLTIEADTMAYDEAKELQSQMRSNKDNLTTLDAKYIINGIGLSAAEMALNAAKKGKVISEKMLEFGLYREYYGVALAQEKLDISNMSVTRLKELYDTVMLKFKLGLATKNDSESALVSYNASLNDVKNAQLDLQTARQKLNQVLSIALDSNVKLKEVLVAENLAVKPLAEALEYAVDNRLDLFLKRETKNLKTLKFTITENFYISRIVSALKKEEIEKFKSENEYLKSIESAKISVQSAYNTMLKAQNAYQSIQSSLTVLQNGYNTTKKMYELGMVPSSQVADMANKLSELEYQVKGVLLQKNIAARAYVLSYEVGGAE